MDLCLGAFAFIFRNTIDHEGQGDRILKSIPSINEIMNHGKNMRTFARLKYN